MSSCHLICRRYGNIGKLWLSFAINKHHLAFLNLKKKLKNAYIYLNKFTKQKVGSSIIFNFGDTYVENLMQN